MRRPVARTTLKATAWTLGGALLVSTAAVALPWDTDLADQQFVRGYECWEYGQNEAGETVCVRSMEALPEGVVSQANILSPTPYKTDALDKMDMTGWAAVQNPLSPSPEVLAKGEVMFRTYCTPCHGAPDAKGHIEALGTVAQPGRMAGVAMLSGDTGVLSARTDGQVYRVIRLGNAIMPSYSWAMSDDEMWSIVHYTRKLENGAYVPPPAPEPTEEEAP